MALVHVSCMLVAFASLFLFGFLALAHAHLLYPPILDRSNLQYQGCLGGAMEWRRLLPIVVAIRLFMASGPDEYIAGFKPPIAI